MTQPGVGGRPGSELRGAGTLRRLDRATSWVEQPIRAVGRRQRLDPLPHAGTISVFLLVVVTVTGLYLTLFFEFGYEASYRSVAAMEDHAIQKVVRAVHRYASAALVVTTLVHAWRIFVAGRFTGRPRRWRWATGVASLLLVWLAGVTGYWLVWDVRAQALSEATAGLLDAWGWGAAVAVDHLLGVGGSGSGILLVMWFLHLGLTAAIGWFAFRHLRRTRLAWLPPRPWMVVMGVALLLVSLVVPVGMLEPAAPGRLLPDMPIDPFVLFLLPPLTGAGAWWWLGAGAVLSVVAFFVPRLLRRSDPPVPEILADACTGCELCVIDCPYEALHLAPRDPRPLAVLDPTACVSCGICVGSCAFDAVVLPGVTDHDTSPGLPAELDGQVVAFVCDRHDPGIVEVELESSVRSASDGIDGRRDRPSTPALVSVRCAGALGPHALAEAYERGAADVHLVGCRPGECRFGIGNQLAEERIEGSRAPHLPRRWRGRMAEEGVGPHLEPAGPEATGREAYLGVAVLVLLSIIVIAVATRAPFSTDDDEVGVRVVVDHTAGRPLQVLPDQPVGRIVAVVVTVGGDEIARFDVASSGERSVGFGDSRLAPTGSAAQIDLGLELDNGDVVAIPAAEIVPDEAGRRALIVLDDVPEPVDAADGRRLFSARSVGCQVCHSTEAGRDGVGPSLFGVATAAADRVEGLSAETYLRQSILLPDEYIVPGWPAGQMLPVYLENLTPDEVDALVAYLLTLEGEGS